MEQFNAVLDEESMEYCAGCDERLFRMRIRDGNCWRCKAGKSHQSFSKVGEFDPFLYPAHLSHLTEVEEMLISRFHMHMQVYQIRGARCKYAGHTASCPQHIQKIAINLPRVPSSRAILIRRPRLDDYTEARINARFAGRTTVRCEPILK